MVTFSYVNIDDYRYTYTGLAFVDLRMACDTVSHKTLLENWVINGIWDVAYLIQSCLQNRKQFVSINQSQSDLKSIFRGAPQDSLPHLLFFFIYISRD